MVAFILAAAEKQVVYPRKAVFTAEHIINEDTRCYEVLKLLQAIEDIGLHDLFSLHLEMLVALRKTVEDVEKDTERLNKGQFMISLGYEGFREPEGIL
jgi:hypothetical protein